MLKTHVFDEAEDGGEELGEAFEDGSNTGAGRHRGLRQLMEAGHQDGQPAAYQLLKALLLCGPQLCNHREANITALLYRETDITALLYRETDITALQTGRQISQLCYTGRWDVPALP